MLNGHRQRKPHLLNCLILMFLHNTMLSIIFYVWVVLPWLALAWSLRSWYGLGLVWPVSMSGRYIVICDPHWWLTVCRLYLLCISGLNQVYLCNKLHIPYTSRYCLLTSLHHTICLILCYVGSSSISLFGVIFQLLLRIKISKCLCNA